jgi:hypothetical protein
MLAPRLGTWRKSHAWCKGWVAADADGCWRMLTRQQDGDALCESGGHLRPPRRLTPPPQPPPLQAQPHIEKHITSAAWWKSLCKQAEQLEAELRTLVASSLKSVPALAPYADPVTVQLAVYFVFAAPVLTLLLASCALRPRRQPADKLSKARPVQKARRK